MKDNQVIIINAIYVAIRNNDFARATELSRTIPVHDVHTDLLCAAIHQLHHTLNFDENIELIKLLVDRTTSFSRNELDSLKRELDSSVKYLGRPPVGPILYNMIKTGHLPLVEWFLLRSNAQDHPLFSASHTPLYGAVESGNIEMVKLLLTKGVNINLRVRDWDESILYKAAKLGDLRMVKFLVECKADVNAYASYPPLFGAVESKNIEIVKFLLAKGAPLHYRDKSVHNTALNIATRQGDEQMIKFLLEQSDYSERTQELSKVFNTALCFHHVSVIAILLEAYPNMFEIVQYESIELCIPGWRTMVIINQSPTSISRAIFMRECYSQLEMIKLLIHKEVRLPEPEQKLLDLYKAIFDCDLDMLRKQISCFTATDKYVAPLLHVAVLHFGQKNAHSSDTPLESFEGIEVLQLLLEYLNVNERGKTETTPLSIAVSNGWITLVKFLLQHNADANLRYSYSDSHHNALHAAIKGKQESTVSFLVTNNYVKVDDAALCLAVEQDNLPMLQLLLEYHNNINAIDLSGRMFFSSDPSDYVGYTLLQIAAMKGFDSMAKYLLEHGANIEAEDRSGKTPLVSASKFSIVKLLIDHGATVNSDMLFKVLRQATEAGDATLVTQLIKNGARVTQDQLLTLALLAPEQDLFALIAGSRIDLWYTGDQINHLLHYLLPDNMIQPPVPLSNNSALSSNIQTALHGLQTAAVLPLSLNNNHWVGLILRRDANGEIHAIYNDPMGNELTDTNRNLLENHLREFNNGIDITITDLHLAQQTNGHDCGPITVNNLVRLALGTLDYTNLSTFTLSLENMNLISTANQDLNLRQRHSEILAMQRQADGEINLNNIERLGELLNDEISLAQENEETVDLPQMTQAQINDQVETKNEDNIIPQPSGTPTAVPSAVPSSVPSFAPTSAPSFAPATDAAMISGPEGSFTGNVEIDLSSSLQDMLFSSWLFS